MQIIELLPVFVSFFITLLVLPRWIKKCRETGLVWEDMNKSEHPKNVAASGGIIVIMAFVLSILFYVAIRTFLLQKSSAALEIFGLLSVILILAIIGLVDDLLGWKNGGLSARLRVFLAFAAAIPLMVINAGNHTVNLPALGVTDLGIIYPLILIPIGIAGATTTYNFLAGFNGLEAGQGIIIISFLSFISYIRGNEWLALTGVIMIVSLAVFYFYNKYPARVFPGDILTYSIGALIAGMAILGNFEKIAVFVFIPYIIEVVLKLRGGLKKQSFAIPNKDNSLELPYSRSYSLTHVSVRILKKFKKKVYEREVCYLIFSVQIVICLAALWVFRGGLF